MGLCCGPPNTVCAKTLELNPNERPFDLQLEHLQLQLEVYCTGLCHHCAIRPMHLVTQHHNRGVEDTAQSCATKGTPFPATAAALLMWHWMQCQHQAAGSYQHPSSQRHQCSARSTDMCIAACRVRATSPGWPADRRSNCIIGSTC